MFLFLFSLLNFSLSLSPPPLSSLSILMSNVLNSASCGLLVSLWFSTFFLSLLPFFFFIWDMFLFILTLAISLYLFLCVRASVFLCLDIVNLGSRCPVGPVAQSPWSPESDAPGVFPYVGFVCSPIVVEFWLLLAHQWEGLTLGLIHCGDWLWQQ